MKENRITIKFIQKSTNKELLKVENQTWMEVGKFFTDQIKWDMVKRKYPNDFQTLKNKNDVRVIAYS